MSFERLLIPPRQIKRTDGFFKWPDKTLLASARACDALPLDQLATDLRRRLKVGSTLSHSCVAPATLRVQRDHRIGGEEAFHLNVTPAGIVLRARTDHGAYYGIQLLRDMLCAFGRKLPACDITDSPDFKRRGVYLDCARGKVPTLETLKSLIERLAAWRVNELQLYIENTFMFERHPRIGHGFSPFTGDDILAIQEHCRKHFIRFVPSLASFGHMETILALPEYRSLGEQPGTHGRKGGTTLCPGDAGSIRLIKELYEEFVPLFEADDFNICCDETWELGQGRSLKRAEHIGKSRVYIDFVNKIKRVVDKHGKRTNMWADIVLKYPEDLGLLSKDMVMLNWEYGANGPRIPRTREIAETGLPFMVCPGTSCWQTHGTAMQNAIENVANFVTIGRRYGAEGVLNTDWGDSGHRNTLGVSLHGLAHGAAHSWNGRAVDDANFTSIFCERFFGAKSLARALRLLGQTHAMAGTQLYHALVSPIVSGGQSYLRGISSRSPVWLCNAHVRDDFAKALPDGLRAIVAQLSAARLWPARAPGLDAFERESLDEIELAARMETTAGRRTLLGLSIRADKRVTPAELRRLATDMQRMTRDFETIWLARNRPSRLKDNLLLLTRATEELRQLSRG